MGAIPWPPPDVVENNTAGHKYLQINCAKVHESTVSEGLALHVLNSETLCL